MPIKPIDDLSYPNPEDFATILENEFVPGNLIGSFQWMPPEAFRPSTTVRNFKVPFDHTQENAAGRIADILATYLGYATLDDESEYGPLVRVLPFVDFHFTHLVASRCDLHTMSYRGEDPDTDPDNLPPMASAN